MGIFWQADFTEGTRYGDVRNMPYSISPGHIPLTVHAAYSLVEIDNFIEILSDVNLNTGGGDAHHILL